MSRAAYGAYDVRGLYKALGPRPPESQTRTCLAAPAKDPARDAAEGMMADAQ
jgi:hypothetical protein